VVVAAFGLLDRRDLRFVPSRIDGVPNPRRLSKMEQSTRRVKSRGGIKSMHKLNFRRA
jgi:hypothetical protein